MQARWFPMAVLVALPLTYACAAAVPSAADEKPKIDTLRSQIEAAENAGSVDDVIRTLAGDIIVMPPGAPAVNGAADTTSMLRGLFDMNSLKVRYQSQEVSIDGSLGFDRGTYQVTTTPKDGSAPTEEVGKYIWTLRREADGSWKYTRFIWNSDAAAPAK